MKNIYNNLHNKKTLGIVSFVIITGVFLMLLASCEESVLDKTPTDSYSDAAVWNDEALTESFANNAYKVMPYGFQRMSWRILPYANMTDESNSRNSWSTIGVIIMGDQSPSYSGPLDVWTNPGDDRSYWDPITQANKFLDNIVTSTIDEELKDRLSAEMRVIRAYSYFQLISHYGGVPLITKSFSLDDDFKLPRDSYSTVMDFVISELDECMNLLPLEYDQTNTGRLTKGAAMAIKARALLYAASPLNNPGNNSEKWQAAADAAKAIIDLNIYELNQDYKVLFTEAGGYNTKEVIWGRPQNMMLTRKVLKHVIILNGWAGYGHAHPLQNLIDDYEM